MKEFTAKELGDTGKQSFNESRREYNLLMKKYREQQKILNSLKKSEKLEIREHFKNLSPTGRRRKYTPLTIKNKIVDYFATVMAKNKPPTVSGLMVHLKMHRDQFYAYSGYPEFKEIMEQTKNLMENWYEESVALGRFNPSGLQFVLKNRFGWTDTVNVKQEVTLDEKQLVARIESLAPELAELFSTAGQLKMLENTPPVLEGVVVDEAEENLETYLREVQK